MIRGSEVGAALQQHFEIVKVPSPRYVFRGGGGGGLGSGCQQAQSMSIFISLLPNDTVVGVLSNRQVAPCFLQCILIYDLIGCSQQRWEVGIGPIFQKGELTCLRVTC